MKKKYFDLEISVMELYTEDVITVSPGDGSDENVPGIVLPEDEFPLD